MRGHSRTQLLLVCKPSDAAVNRSCQLWHHQLLTHVGTWLYGWLREQSTTRMCDCLQHLCWPAAGSNLPRQHFCTPKHSQHNTQSCRAGSSDARTDNIHNTHPVCCEWTSPAFTGAMAPSLSSSPAEHDALVHRQWPQHQVTHQALRLGHLQREQPLATAGPCCCCCWCWRGSSSRCRWGAGCCG